MEPDTQIRGKLRECLDYLLDRCDGAVSKDNQGFGKVDAYYARAIRDWPLVDWDKWHDRTLWERLAKYHKQLAAGGINFHAIPEPEVVEPTKAHHTRSLLGFKPLDIEVVEDGYWVARELLKEAGIDGRSIVGAKADAKRRAWFFPIGTEPTIRQLAGKARAVVTGELHDPDYEIKDHIIRREGDGFRVENARKSANASRISTIARQEGGKNGHIPATPEIIRRLNLGNYLLDPEAQALLAEYNDGTRVAKGPRRIEEHPTHWSVFFPYDAELVQIMREQPNRVWNPDAKCWNIQGSPELRAWLEGRGFTFLPMSNPEGNP